MSYPKKDEIPPPLWRPAQPRTAATQSSHAGASPAGDQPMPCTLASPHFDLTASIA